MSKNIESDNTKIYEISYIIASSVPEEKVSKEADSIKAILTKANAEMVGEGHPSFRDLAYTMSKNIGGRNEKYTQGYFGWYKFAISNDIVESVKKDIDAMDSVIRTLLISTVREDTFLGKLSKGVETDNVKSSLASGESQNIDQNTDSIVVSDEIKNTEDEAETTNEA